MERVKVTERQRDKDNDRKIKRQIDKETDR